MTLRLIIIIALVIFFVWKIINKKAGVKPATTVQPEEACGVFFMLRPYYRDREIKNMETILLPLGKKVTFEAKGFDVKGKPACIDGTKVNWKDSCGKQIFDSATGVTNSITINSEANKAIIVTVEYLKHTFSWKITANKDYIDPTCNRKK